MAAATTTYDIKVNYMLDDKASKALTGVGKSADRASKSMFSLSKMLRAVALGYVAIRGIKGISKVFVGTNAELESTKNSLASILQLTQGIQSRSAAQSKAGTLLGDLRELAKTSPGTFQEMANFAKQIAPAVGRAGGSIEQLKKLSQLGVVASSAFGIKKDVAGRDIRQALTRGVTAKDELPLLLGIDPESFNKLGSSDRLKELEKAIDNKALRDAAEEFKTSFEGSSSTLKSNLQEFAQVMGEEVFGVLTQTMVDANKFFIDNRKEIMKFAKQAGGALVSAFNTVKAVVLSIGRTLQFIVDNKVLLVGLASALSVGVLGKGFMKAVSSFGTNVGKMNGGLIALTAAFATAAAAFLEHDLAKTQERTLKTPFSLLALEQADKARMAAAAEFFGVNSPASPNYKFLVEAAQRAGAVQGNELTKNAREILHEQIGLNETFAPSLAGMGEQAARTTQVLEAIAFALKKDYFIDPGAINSPELPPGYGRRDNKDIKATLVVNVASDDPDRFAIGLEDYFRSAVHNPAAAARVLREGK